MKRLLLVVAVAALLPGARVQEPLPSPAPPFRAEFLVSLADSETKLLQLAQAIPARSYTWRPTPDVRSISEVFTHVAGSNYFLATFLGRQPPAGIPSDIEKITEKQRVIAELKKSFVHVRAAASAMKADDLERAVRMFGSTTTQRGVYIAILTHVSEHLGQSITYARMTGVAPPWSR